MPRSSAAPWGQLYGCLCSSLRPHVEPSPSPAEVDQSFAIDSRPLRERLKDSAAAVLMRASLKRMAGMPGLRRWSAAKIH
jgi:hypothetical protein